MSERGFVLEGSIGAAFSKSEDQLIMENVKRILLTQRGERLNELEFGSDFRKYLFSPESRISDVINEIRNSITRCESRVTVSSVTLTKKEDDEFTIRVNLIKNSNNEEISTEIDL